MRYRREAAGAETAQGLAAGVASPTAVRASVLRAIAILADADRLRLLVVAAGLAWAIAFPLVGVGYQLQTFGDGALFSYAVAAQQAWAFHWHNISARIFVFLAASLPAETYVELSGDARGGIALYGLLFFAAPLIGLAATFALDRSAKREFFVCACASTACLCPLVFGAPTEMWTAHAIFWPALAACHGAQRKLPGQMLVFALMLALVLTHEGALLLAGSIVASLAPRGWRHAHFRRAAVALGCALIVWTAIKLAFPPDPYTAEILMRLALGVFDLDILDGDLLRLLAGTLAGYALAFALLSHRKVANAEDHAFCLVTAALGVYWLWFDQSLHAENRYYLRTVLIVVTPLLGLLAASRVLRASGCAAPTTRMLAFATMSLPARMLARLLLIVALIHTVETAKFALAWSAYRQTMLALAGGAAGDASLGNARFVSSERLDTADSRLAWPSTSPFLSVLVTPTLAPAHLVVAPETNFFWLSCETATASAQAPGALPDATRELLQVYSCLHRPQQYVAR